MIRNRAVEFRVGIFVFTAICLGGLSAFVVGNQRNIFDDKTEYRVLFEDVQGLRKGSPVQIAGLVVGSITHVAFTDDGHVDVRFTVISEHSHLIRGNPRIPIDADPAHPPTVASIGTKGMLGDKQLNLTVGDSTLPAWPSERYIPISATSGDLMAAASRVMGDVQGVAANLREATEPFRDQRFANDLAATAANLSRISEEIATGNGTMGRLLRDPEMADEVEATLANLRRTSDDIAAASRAARAVADEVRTGDGSAHRLIYGPEAADAAANIGRASDELALALRQVREGDGTLHDLVYGDEGRDLIRNLTAASEDVAAIMDGVRAGRGTIGGLLVDPSIYEDVKRLVGDLQRNDILRALVRYSIRRDAPVQGATADEVLPAGGTP